MNEIKPTGQLEFLSRLLTDRKRSQVKPCTQQISYPTIVWWVEFLGALSHTQKSFDWIFQQQRLCPACTVS